MTSPRFQPWIEKWRPNDWRDDPLPPEATTIADDLPAEAHEVLLLGCPWDLEMTPHVAMLLEFYDLLDDDKLGLNRLGIQVKRLLSQWDVDWDRRSKIYRAQVHAYFEPAYRIGADQALVVANQIDPDLAVTLRFIVAHSSKQISVRQGIGSSTAQHLVDLGVAQLTPARGGHWITPTDFGRAVACYLEATAAFHAEAFDGARQSKWAEQRDEDHCKLMEGYISLLSHHLKGWAA